MTYIVCSNRVKFVDCAFAVFLRRLQWNSYETTRCPAISQVLCWPVQQIHDGCQTKHGDLVIMTRWDVDIATDEQMQAESESEDTACLSDLHSTEQRRTVSLFSSEEKHSFRYSLARRRIRAVSRDRKRNANQIAAKGWRVSILGFRFTVKTLRFSMLHWSHL